ncbi:MAG: hypothetical protein AABX79_03135 [Nanoarchaeota archaeon]
MKRGSIRMQNRKGLSTIVATLIIILLTLVAVGIIWVVIRNVVEGGAQQVDISQKCLAVELTGVTVNETAVSSGIYNVTLRRGSDSQGDVGVKANVFSGQTTSSGVIAFGAVGDLDALGTVTRSIDTNTATAVPGGDKVEYTAFFLDSSGNEQLCPQTKSFNF